MEIINYNEEDKSIVERSQNDVNDILPIVKEILDNIKLYGDSAIKKYSEKFDNVKTNNFKVSKEEIEESYTNIDEKFLKAIKKAISNIKKFHKLQLPKEWCEEINEGIMAGVIVRPIENVGCYIPGGRAIYPSTVLMNVIPAKIAGVNRVICCSPPNLNGEIDDAILVAADLAGADEIYKVGGVQAIGAMAYGTRTIEKVDKIVGPGNIFVTGAKKLVYGEVDIEFEAGPSEILIISDESGNSEYISYDILSQAEHDPNSSCYLVTHHEKLAVEVKYKVSKLIENTKRKDIVKESLGKYGKIILTNNLKESIDFSNRYAPEHLMIMTNNYEEVLKEIKNAGSIFLGNYSPVAAGDYGSGTNHVLPTGTGGRVYSGLSTESFLKKPTVQKITYDGLKDLSETILPISEYEGFHAHSDSVRVRLKKID
ncbi:MAG: histidinol dehydrogenase [Methanobrevibacter sp.]|jgi:histidinol dehydrogenase|nr:histidinol dehydrogenase [Candidatus Methanovirga basalitermitum]